MPNTVLRVAAATLCIACATAAWARDDEPQGRQPGRIALAVARTAHDLVHASPPSRRSLPIQEADGFRVFWRDGLRMETADGNFQFRIGGRIQYDWTFWGDSAAIEESVGSLDNGTEFRRARLYVQGYLYGNVEFKAQYDFAGGDASFKDVYFGTRGLPANVRLGHFKEPFSLEELTSSKYVTFIERSLPNVFTPSRNSGFMVHGDIADGRASYGVGLFRDSDDFGGGTGDNYDLTGRLAGAPLYEDDGERVVHVGAALTWKHVDDASAVRFRERPEVHVAPRFVDTGAFAADSVRIVDLEAALVFGPVSAQGEYTVASVQSAPAADPTFSGYYVMGSYWITGERRNYDGGVFSRVRPHRNFLDGEGGHGAWEVALRYSALDLSDGPISHGKLANVTVGVNWHWNPMTRLSWNIVRTDLEGVDEAVAALWRGQVEF